MIEEKRMTEKKLIKPSGSDFEKRIVMFQWEELAKKLIPTLPNFITFDYDRIKNNNEFDTIKNKFISPKETLNLNCITIDFNNINDDMQEQISQLLKIELNPFKGKVIKYYDDNVEYFKSIKSEWAESTSIKTNKLADLYIQYRNMFYYGKSFYDINGYLDSDLLKNDIVNIIGSVTDKSVNKLADEVIQLLKPKCANAFKSIKLENTINVKNATLVLEDNKIKVKPSQIGLNRLNVDYTPYAPIPSKFLNFLNELFTQDEIIVLQEYLGYILIPTLKGQKMLLITGKGGEGKSTLLEIVKNILGGAIQEKEFNKMFNDKFGFTNVEGKLAICDDDMPTIDIKSLNLLKKFVTNNILVQETKNVDEKNIKHNARFIGLGNNLFSSKLSSDDALIRRLIVLEVKPKQKNSIIIRDLYKELLKEKEGIFNWMLEGLIRLSNNDFNFSYENEMKNIVNDLLNGDSGYIHRFLKDESYIIFQEEFREHSQRLYDTYILWCAKNNGNVPVSKDKFYLDLSRVSNLYNISGNYTFEKDGKRAKGYKGIKIVKGGI